MTKEIPTEAIKKSYDESYRDLKFGGPGYTHAWILKLLRPQKGKRLLDIGCSQGFLVAEAQRSGLDVSGIDISSEAVRIARENVPSAEIVCGDAHRLEWNDNSFDYVTNIGSLEHFRDPDKCLNETKRVMKPDGLACIMLPNLYYYRHIINKIFRKKDPTSYQAIERFGSLKEWSAMLEGNGFKIIKIYKYNKFNRSKFMVFMRTFLVPLMLSHHFVFILRKDRR